MRKINDRALGARSLLLLAATLGAFLVGGATEAWACACGCDIFDVSGSGMFPHGAGGRIYLEYDYQNQHSNWHLDSHAPGYLNDDKQIETHFLTLGFQYMVNDDWGFQIEAPYVYRRFVTTGGASGSDTVFLHYDDLGDVRVKGIFDGFLEDHSLGVTLGLKLPTGNYTYNDSYGDVDRDSEIGSGSTDLLVGGFFHKDLLGGFGMYFQVLLDLPVLNREHYYPGIELDAVLGTYFTWTVSDTVKITPLAQLIESARGSDTGKASADPVASGFERIFVSPGVEVDVGPVMVYVDVEVPVYVHVTGNQLVAPLLLKAMVGYKF